MYPADFAGSHLKNSAAAADAEAVNATVIRPHQIRVSPSDLEALARLWGWERTIRENLDSVLDTGKILTLVHGIFDIRLDAPLLVGYQALSRFPSSPRIPSGLWFAVAGQTGVGDRLTTETGLKAIALIPRLPVDTMLFTHASPRTVAQLIEGWPRDVLDRLIIQIPFRSAHQAGFEDVARIIRECGAGLAVDNAPGMGTWVDRLEAAGSVPAFVTVDLSGGLGEPEVNDSYGRLAAWCDLREVKLVAKRVEQVTELGSLKDLGFAWAQGYSLSTPAEP